MAVYLPYLMALMMFTMGLNLSLDNFKAISEKPISIFIGSLCQLILLPILAIIIIQIFNLKPDIAMGIAILCACPGGVLSNYLSFIAKGDMALSISLTIISSLVCLFSIPLIVNGIQFFLQIPSNEIQLPILATIKKLGLITLLPIVTGLLLNHFLTINKKISQLLSISCTVLLITYILYLWFIQKETILSSYKIVGLPVMVLIISSSLIAFLAAKIAHLSMSQQITLIIETSIQNSALAFTVAVGLLGNMAYSIPIIFYTVAMFIPAIILYVFSKQLINNST